MTVFPNKVTFCSTRGLGFNMRILGRHNSADNINPDQKSLKGNIIVHLREGRETQEQWNQGLEDHFDSGLDF